MKRAGKKAAGISEPEDFWAKQERAWMVAEANFHLYCYGEDRDPLHMLRAVLVVVESGEALDSIMVDNFRRAISLLEKPRPRNGKPPPRYTARNLRVLRDVLARCGTTTVPKRVKDQIIAAIASKEGISKENVRMIVSRFRARQDGRLAR